jgi:hypothetical protein
MKKWIVIAALFCLAAVPAFADVTNEVFVGFQGDGTTKVTDAAGNDITDTMKIGNSQFTLQYSHSHFFSPLKDDEKPIELHRFYQHPSSLTIGLLTEGYAKRDSTNPIVVRETKRGVGMLMLSGELYLSTNTGFFLNIGGGSGKEKVKVAGIDLPETDLEVSSFDLGVRQYIGSEFRMHLRFQGETTKTTPAGLLTETSKTGLVFFGVQGVIRDTLGLAAEIGGGERSDEISGSKINYDVGAVNLEGNVYVGKEFSFGLKIEGETQKRTTLPENTIKRGRSTLSARYWFSEKIGLQVPFYSETVKDDVSGKTVSSGMGLYATFRF